MIRGNRTRIRQSLEFHGVSRTEQSHKESCDVNNIVQRHVREGMLPPPRTPPQFVDVTALQGTLQERLAFRDDIMRRLDDWVAKMPGEEGGTPPSDPGISNPTPAAPSQAPQV